MLALFRQVSLRHLAAHKLRTVMTLAGIAFGVGSIVAMWLLNDLCARAYEDAVDRLAGKAQLQIANGQAGIPEELLDEIERVPAVAAAAPTVQGSMKVAGMRGERLYIFGVDMLADSKVRVYAADSAASASLKDPLVFLAQPDSVALTTAFMRAKRLRIGDRISLSTAAGPVSLKIRGSLKAVGPAAIFDGRFALMDIFAAEKAFGLDHRFTQIDIVPARGARLEKLQAALQRTLAGRAAIARPAMRGKAMETILAGQRSALVMGGVFALVVGIYLVFNTMLISVTQRRRGLGILRATGMRRVEVVRLIAGEALLNGLLGSALGVALALWLAEWLLPSFSAAVYTGGWTGMVPPQRLSGRLDMLGADLAAAIGLGILSALVAAVIPAIEAVRITPVDAIRPPGTIEEQPRSFASGAYAG